MREEREVLWDSRVGVPRRGFGFIGEKIRLKKRRLQGTDFRGTITFRLAEIFFSFLFLFLINVISLFPRFINGHRWVYIKRQNQGILRTQKPNLNPYIYSLNKGGGTTLYRPFIGLLGDCCREQSPKIFLFFISFTHPLMTLGEPGVERGGSGWGGRMAPEVNENLQKLKKVVYETLESQFS